jgi:hypothetical protein
MKHSISDVPIQALLSLGLATMTVSALQAEPHCPGNVAGVTPRFVQHALIVIPVKINQTGPFDFMVDTGAQITTVDPALAAALHLKTQGAAGIIGVGVYARAPLTQLDSLQAGSHSVDAVLAVIQDLDQVQATDPRVRGILGSNFLEHFDVLIDYPHSLLCLDEGKLMQANLKGKHIALARPLHPKGNLPFTQPLIFPVNVAGIKAQLLMELDSGGNVPLLFEAGKELARARFANAPLRTRGSDGIEHTFAVLDPQDVQVGNHVLHSVPFVTPMDEGKDVPNVDVDGLLPTLLFHRVFISFADHFVVFNPK